MISLFFITFFCLINKNHNFYLLTFIKVTKNIHFFLDLIFFKNIKNTVQKLVLQVFVILLKIFCVGFFLKKLVLNVIANSLFYFINLFTN